MKNYYATLEVPVGSDLTVIRGAYRRLVQENLWNKEVFAELKEAYEVLSTPARRRAYDQANFGQTFADDEAASESARVSDRRCPLGAGAQCPVIAARAPLTDTFCPECGVLLAALPAEGLAPVSAEVDPAKVPHFEEPNGDRVHRLRPGLSIVGREAADVLLTDKTVSRRHAQVEITEVGEAFLEDLGSTNGTRIGETVLPPHDRRPLRDGDPVRFGSIPLVLRLPAPSPATAVPSVIREAPSVAQDAPPVPTSGGGEEEMSAEASLVPMELAGTPELGGAPAEPEAEAHAVTKLTPLARLIGERHGAVVREDVLVPGVTTFGRRAENTVVLRDDPYISGMHAQIIADDGTFRLTDLDSTNGTTLNGERMVPNEPATLQPGDQIGIGGLTYRFEPDVEAIAGTGGVAMAKEL